MAAFLFVDLFVLLNNDEEEQQQQQTDQQQVMSLWRNWITRPPPKGKIAGSNPARDVSQIACYLLKNCLPA